ncbi:DUF3502 domain-containing protein [Paenibacillus phytorum]|uniref:DUF3502 domain-containing protein n=1 Tax=Paenibacillus phytorum TaxID=2654977 RepID=UPI0035E43090
MARRNSGEPNDDKHGLKVFNDKLKQAGIEKVVAEMQNQANPLITKKKVEERSAS